MNELGLGIVIVPGTFDRLLGPSFEPLPGIQPHELLVVPPVATMAPVQCRFDDNGLPLLNTAVATCAAIRARAR